MDIQGKVVIITGASSGIGLATAQLLAAHGTKLALVARSTKKIEALSQELPNSKAVTADMTKVIEIKKMVKRIVDHFDRIDILINNAGQGYDARIERTDIDLFDNICNR
jgi:NADP-dependent 3-hydroxy acid dehydrogenase YdfG